MSTIFLSTRPPVTTSDAEKLRSLWETIPQNDIDMFEIHGYIRDTRSKRRTLIYTVEQEGKLGAKVLRLDDLDTESVGDLYKSINQASPVGSDTVRIEEDAKQLSRDRFSLNFNPLEINNGVLASVSAFCKTGVEAKLSCLRVMAKGDCSETTSVTEADGKYVGSLVIGIPTVYDGGKLGLWKGDRKTIICWTATEERQDTWGLRWAFIPLGVESQVQEITSGYRLTLNYKIFATGAALYEFPMDRECCDLQGLDLYNRLKILFHDSKFLLGGGRIAFPCRYEYPTTDLWSISELPTILKGSDYILWHASKKVGYKPSMRIVRKLSVNFNISNTFWLEDVTFKAIIDQGRHRYPVDAFSSYNPNLGRVYLTSDSLRGPPRYACLDGESTGFEFLGDEENGRSILETDLIWAAAPMAWFKESSFIQDHDWERGSTVHSYASGVVILELP